MGGGMAPMHGARWPTGQGEAAYPSLSADEDLYKEDRAWTEGVIGNRRRSDVQDGKDSK